MVGIPEAVAWYGVFILSVTLHECAHAWTAMRMGDPTAYLGGQVSFDPRPHMKRSPFGMIVLPIVSLFLIGWPIGFASAPFDPFWAFRNPRKAAWMAFAGPASNLLLVLLAIAGIRIGIWSGYFYPPESINHAAVTAAGADGFPAVLALMFSVFFTLNLVLTVLNMIPFPPLDGSEIVSLFLSRESARRYQEIIRNPAFGLIGLLLAWHVFAPIFQLIFLGAVNLLYPECSYG